MKWGAGYAVCVLYGINNRCPKKIFKKKKIKIQNFKFQKSKKKKMDIWDFCIIFALCFLHVIILFCVAVVVKRWQHFVCDVRVCA